MDVTIAAGALAVVGGVLILVFDKQYAAWVRGRRTGAWQAPALFEPRPSGVVPASLVIGAGWVLVGLVLLLVGAGVLD